MQPRITGQLFQSIHTLEQSIMLTVEQMVTHLKWCWQKTKILVEHEVSHPHVVLLIVTPMTRYTCALQGLHNTLFRPPRLVDPSRNAGIYNSSDDYLR
jgi:hypothetical protein